MIVKTAMREFFQRWFAKEDFKPTVPPGCRVYAVGDVHGRSDLLDQLIGLIQKDAAGRAGKTVLVFVGDYVDRGRDSKGVIELLLKLPEDFEAHFLRGNHDQILLEFLEEPATYRVWRDFGAVETLLSYDVRPPLDDTDAALGEARDRFNDALPRSHRQFLQRLGLSCEIGDYFFSHAGVRAGVSLAEQKPQDLLWIRDEFLRSKADFGKIVVHGHTPTALPVKRRNRIGIDTGAYFSGRLTAAVLEGASCRFIRSSA